jgi:hypothetical protein
MSLLDAGHEVAKVATADEVADRLLHEPPDIVLFNTGLPAALKSDFISSWRTLGAASKIISYKLRGPF